MYISPMQDDQRTKSLNVRGEMAASYALRHRMLHFLQNFVYYMTLEVIGPRGHELQERIAVASVSNRLLEYRVARTFLFVVAVRPYHSI